VRLRLAREELDRTLIDALGVLASHESAVVQEEPEKLQGTGAKVATQEDVGPDAPVHVLDHGAGAHGVSCKGGHGLLNVVEAPSEPLEKDGLEWPALRILGVEAVEQHDFTHELGVEIELFADRGDPAIKVRCEREQVVALVLQRTTHRSNAVRAAVLTGAKLLDDVVVEALPSREVRADERKNVVLEPVGKRRDVRDELEGRDFLFAGERKPLGELLSLALPLEPPHSVLKLVTHGDHAIGAVLEERDHSPRVPQRMKDVAVTGSLGHRERLTGSQALACVGDRMSWTEPAGLELLETSGPSVGVAVILGGEQIAVGRVSAHSNENGLARLEDLVMGTDPDLGEILTSIDDAGLLDGGMEDVEHRAQRDVVVEDIAEEFDDAPQRAMADQDEGDNELAQPLLRDGDREEDRVVRLPIGGKRPP